MAQAAESRWTAAKMELEQALVSSRRLVRDEPPPRRAEPSTATTQARYGAVTVLQPYAWLLANANRWPDRVLGKTVENRGRQTNYRGPLLIHTSRRWHKVSETLDELRARGLVGDDCPEPTEEEMRAQLGLVIATAQLTGCRKVEAGDAHPWAIKGQWAWELEGVRLVEPFELVGKVGLWFAEPGVRIKPFGPLVLRGLAPMPGVEIDHATGLGWVVVEDIQHAARVLFAGGAKALEQLVELGGERMTAIELAARAAEDAGDPDCAAWFRECPSRYRSCTAARSSCERGPLAVPCESSAQQEQRVWRDWASGLEPWTDEDEAAWQQERCA